MGAKPRKWYFHHIVTKVLSTLLTSVDVDFDYRVEVLLLVKFSFISRFYTVLWKEVTIHSPHLKSKGFGSIFLMEPYCYILFV